MGPRSAGNRRPAPKPMLPAGGLMRFAVTIAVASLALALVACGAPSRPQPPSSAATHAAREAAPPSGGAAAAHAAPPAAAASGAHAPPREHDGATGGTRAPDLAAAPPATAPFAGGAQPRAAAGRGQPPRSAGGDGDGMVIAAVTTTGTPVMRVPANETIVSINTPTPTRTPTRTPTATPTRTPTPSAGAPVVGGCQVFPADNPWNTDISNYPVHPNSANYIAAINAGGRSLLHPDWGGSGAYGIPYIVVPPAQPLVSITWTAYGDESDPGPYPIPLNAPIEGGPSSDGDRHVLAVRQGECVLYELGRAFPGASSWSADVGAKWPLNTNALRPLYWTSADAAGLPILPGLVRYDEVAAGAIHHALRFTSWRTQRAFILPATHYASSRTDPNLPPMGLRFRLKAGYDISGYTGQSRVVLEALRRYGMMVADNGSSWFITGAADPRWDDDDLSQLKSVPSSAFEVVGTGPIIY